MDEFLHFFPGNKIESLYLKPNQDSFTAASLTPPIFIIILSVDSLQELKSLITQEGICILCSNNDINSCGFLKRLLVSIWIFLGHISLPCLSCLCDQGSFLRVSVRLGVNKTQFHFFLMIFFLPLHSFSGRCCFSRSTLVLLFPLHLPLVYQQIKKYPDSSWL